MFAGIWNTWRNRNEVITSCASPDTPANEFVAEPHYRMPDDCQPYLRREVVAAVRSRQL